MVCMKISGSSCYVPGEGVGRQLMCEVCGKEFQRPDLLREHQAVHLPPTHPCPTCFKLFKTRKSLDVHSLIHLDIKRFACKYCNKVCNPCVLPQRCIYETKSFNTYLLAETGVPRESQM